MKTQGRSEKEKSYAKIYDHLYAYSFYVKFLRKQYFNLLKKISTKINSAIDIGCGSGDSTFLIYKSGIKNVIGYDPNVYLIKLAKLKYPFIEFKVGSFENISQVLDKKVDLVTSIFGPISHVVSIDLALANVRKILNNNGLFLFDIFNRYSHTLIKRYNGLVPQKISFRKKIKGIKIKVSINLYSCDLIERKLKEYNFKIIKKISLFNYIIPYYSANKILFHDPIKCYLDYFTSKILKKYNGNVIIYLVKKI